MALNRAPSSPQGPTAAPVDASLPTFLAQHGLSHLADPLANFNLRSLSSLSKVDFESKLRVKVCSKSMREDLWVALHPAGAADQGPQDTSSAVVKVLKDFVATNAISTHGQSSAKDLGMAASAPGVAVPQPRTKAPLPRPAEQHVDPYAVRAVLWISGTEHVKDAAAIVECIGHYGIVVEHGHMELAGPRRKKNFDWMYFKLSGYTKELQSLRRIPLGDVYGTTFPIADLTLFNAGYINDGRPPAPPASYVPDRRVNTAPPPRRLDVPPSGDDSVEEPYPGRGMRGGGHRGFGPMGRGGHRGGFGRGGDFFDDVCRFYKKKPDGCSRGSLCNFIHQD